MDTATLVLALSAGALAALNPCGFALLPAWLTLLVDRETRSRGSAVARAVGLSAAMTVGFVAVFGAFGAVVVPLTLSVEQYLPWATIVIGLVLVAIGVVLLTGRDLVVRVPHWHRVPARGWGAMVAYGAAYALASLSCTVGPFLAVLAATTRADGVAAGMLVVLAYAIGMGLLVTLLAVAVALAQDAVVGGMRRVLPWVNRLSGGLLVLAGAYVTWYGWYEVRVAAGGSTEDPVVDAAAAVQGALAQLVDRIGPAGLAVTLAVALVVIGLVTVRASRRSRGRSAASTS
ncbi:MAG TPA: cytochrome c biogenesis protein CcdA [Lapillicoccus sp.]|nr:cytochrome c biogenesis protein CcdA [Lapillicoccus sp.]